MDDDGFAVSAPVEADDAYSVGKHGFQTEYEHVNETSSCRSKRQTGIHTPSTLQLMNDAKNKVPSFNNISMITNSHSAKGFQLVAWNASGTSLSYRIAVTVHVFDAKQ